MARSYSKIDPCAQSHPPSYSLQPNSLQPVVLPFFPRFSRHLSAPRVISQVAGIVANGPSRSVAGGGLARWPLARVPMQLLLSDKVGLRAQARKTLAV